MVLIGASGAGKSTLASTWPAARILSLDALREAVGNNCPRTRPGAGPE